MILFNSFEKKQTQLMSTPLNELIFPPYFTSYIDLVKDQEHLLKLLENCQQRTSDLIDLTTEEVGGYAYAEGKWTVKELLVHIIDTERVFCYRAMRFARKDSIDLQGFEQDLYVSNSNANARSLCDIFKEYELVRKGTIAIYKSFAEEALKHEGTVNGNKFNVLAIGYIIAGHETHHINVLENKYL